MCVCVCVCFRIIPYINSFGRTALYVCIEYCIQVNMYHVSVQGIDERRINAHYYYYCHCQTNRLCFLLLFTTIHLTPPIYFERFLVSTQIHFFSVMQIPFFSFTDAVYMLAYWGHVIFFIIFHGLFMIFLNLFIILLTVTWCIFVSVWINVLNDLRFRADCENMPFGHWRKKWYLNLLIYSFFRSWYTYDIWQWSQWLSRTRQL